MLERERGNIDKANKYFSAVTVSNIVLSVILLIPSLLIVLFLDSIVNIPVQMVYEVKITFALTFITFIINLFFSTYGNCYFLSNHLDKNNIRNVESNIIKIICIIGLYYVFSPSIIFMAIGTFIATVYIVICNFYYHKKLTPDLKIYHNSFDTALFREILSSGIWNSITRLSQIFSSGLDLLIANLLIGSTEMGYLSVAKTIPNITATFNATISSVFSPNMMKLYADGNNNELIATTKSAMKIMCVFCCIPSAILIVIGEQFFSLWVPEQPSRVINILSVLTITNSCITGPLQPIYQIFTITNHVKSSSIALITYGVWSISTTYICIKVTSLGVYAIAGVSLVGSVLIALLFHAPFAAKYIGMPWHCFFPELIKSVVSLFIVCVAGFGVKSLFSDVSWFIWFAQAAIITVLGVSLNFVLVLNKAEKKWVIDRALKRVKR
jgi:O-antigen/teichoic acid export membrane protein